MRSGKTYRVAVDAMFAALALMLTFVESVIPISGFVPIPGFRLGLANVSVMTALFYSGRVDALGVALVKVFVSTMLFSNPMSFMFSFAGTVFSLSALMLFSYSRKELFGFIGFSVISAVFHNCGQVAVAVVVFGTPALSFVPYLLLASLVSGVFTGILICSVAPVLNRLFIKQNGK